MCITVFGRFIFYPHHPSFDIAAAVLPLTGMFEAYLVELFFFELLLPIPQNQAVPVLHVLLAIFKTKTAKTKNGSG